MKAESRGEQKPLQRVEQALHVLSPLVDRFIEPGVAQPDLRVPLAELCDRLNQMLPSSSEPAVRKVVVSDDPLDACSLPWLIA